MRNLIRRAPVFGFKHPNLNVAEAKTVSGFRLPPTFLLVLCAALLASCGGGGGSGSSGGSSNGGTVSQSTYLPLDANSRWIYTNTPGSAQTTVRVLGAQSVNGHDGILVQDIDASSNGISDSVYVKTSAGVFEYPTVGSDPLTKAIGAFQLMRFPLSMGDSFIQVDKSVDSGLDFDGDGISDRVALHSVVTVVGFENISTPAGNFSNCLHQHTVATETISLSTSGESVTIDVTSDDWYAPDVGLVRSSATARNGNISDTSTQTLVAFGVGSRKSEAAPPTVQTVTPASIGAGSVVAVSAVFSEAMDAASLSSGAFTVVGSNNQAVAGTVQVDGTSARFTPTQPWASGSYTARISTAAQDLVGNALASERTWSFTTDAAGPGVVSTTPVDGAQDVGLASPIVLQFSEPLDPATVNSGTVTLMDLNNTIPTTVAVSGATVTLTPTASLQPGKTYWVSVGPVADAFGNRMIQDYRFTFQTDQNVFAYPVQLATTFAAYAVAIGDINSDSINDVVLTSGAANDVADFSALFVLPGQAGGTLGAPSRIGNGRFLSCSLYSLAIGDLNADGRNDVAVGGSCGAQVFLQAADGSLVAGEALNGSGLRTLRIADLNGDGHKELIGAGSGDVVSIWRQDGTGHLALQATPSFGISSGADDMEVGDVNGDGRPDLVVVVNPLSQAPHVAVLRQQGSGTFASPIYLDADPSNGAHGVAIGDMNGDGRNDVVVTTQRNYIGIYYQAADGSLGAMTTAPSSSYATLAVRVADINNDGRADLVVSHQGWEKVGVYMQQADGTLATEVLFVSPYGAFNPNSMAVGDVNRDGRPDIVFEGGLLRQKPTASSAALRALSAPAGA